MYFSLFAEDSGIQRLWNAQPKTSDHAHSKVLREHKRGHVYELNVVTKRQTDEVGISKGPANSPPLVFSRPDNFIGQGKV